MFLIGFVLCTMLQEALLGLTEPEPQIMILAPKIKLRDGAEMPSFALGTYLGYGEDDQVKRGRKRFRTLVARAIDMGYRHFDTAPIYGTEEEVGEAIAMKIREGVISRQDAYFTTKLWNTGHKREQVIDSLRESLKKSKLSYVDLYLIHWPMGLNEDYSASDVDYMETWRGMEDAMRAGLARSIGVSNFNKEQLQRVLSEATVKPVALQIEVHPQIIQTELIDLCKSEGIVVMGYSPLGSLVMRFGVNNPGPKITDPLLVSLAHKYGKTPTQVVLRWAVDRGVVPLPKTFNMVHLAENLNIFDFKLEADEIENINQYNSNIRYTLPSFWQDHPYYPFEKIDNPIPDPFKP